MVPDLVAPEKARSGDKVAVLSPSFAAPGAAPAVHEQAMRRLTEVTGLIPVEYPTTRQLRASPQDRAADLNAAFADPKIRAVLATIGGEDQITVVPYLNAEAVRADPKPYLGYSDNTNILSWLWTQGVAGFYGGSTQVQLGPARPSTRVTLLHSRRLYLRASDWRLLTLASRRTSARIGPIRLHLPSSGTVRPPSRGPGPARNGV
jgi:muramoyltetrapeptide carboxypeptidase LdcA involved in peptidoglycan recycling